MRKGSEIYKSLSKRIAANHAGDISYRESGMIRQQRMAEHDELIRNAQSDCIRALEQIRDGHNDPRALATEVLLRLAAL